MKAFEFDHHLIDSYARFSRSFSTIRAADLKSEIDRQYYAGRFWPDALLSLNPKSPAIELCCCTWRQRMFASRPTLNRVKRRAGKLS